MYEILSSLRARFALHVKDCEFLLRVPTAHPMRSLVRVTPELPAFFVCYRSMSFDLRKRSFQEEDRHLCQQTFLDACKAGDVVRLRKLFDHAGVNRGDRTITWLDSKHSNSPPSTFSMLRAAISNSQVDVLKLLLETFPSACTDMQFLETASLLGSSANPTLRILQVYHSFDPSIVDLYMDEKCLITLLMDYCQNGDPRIAEWLLENGADPNGGMMPVLRDALSSALSAGRSPSLVKK